MIEPYSLKKVDRKLKGRNTNIYHKTEKHLRTSTKINTSKYIHKWRDNMRPGNIQKNSFARNNRVKRISMEM